MPHSSLNEVGKSWLDHSSQLNPFSKLTSIIKPPSGFVLSVTVPVSWAVPSGNSTKLDSTFDYWRKNHFLIKISGQIKNKKGAIYFWFMKEL